MTRIGAVYVRVSTDEQARSGLSLRDQRETLTALAKREGLEVRVYEDAGRSGETMHRPALTRLLEDVLARLRPVAVVGLEATPEGAPVYGALGFTDRGGFARMERPGDAEPVRAERPNVLDRPKPWSPPNSGKRKP